MPSCEGWPAVIMSEHSHEKGVTSLPSLKCLESREPIMTESRLAQWSEHAEGRGRTHARRLRRNAGGEQERTRTGRRKKQARSCRIGIKRWGVVSGDPDIPIKYRAYKSVMRSEKGRIATSAREGVVQ
jgi:hypothetical protein